MRVIVSCVPQSGHIMPLLPLAEAFAARGDEVTFASGPDVAKVASERGLSFHAIGPNLDAWFAALRARTRGSPGDGLAPSRVQGYFVPRVFGEIGMALTVDDLLALCEQVEPALLVFDPYLLAGPLVATLTGTRAVLHSLGALQDQQVLDLVSDAVSPIWREYGLFVPPQAGVYCGTTLTICPPSLEPAAIGLEGAQQMRPAPLPLTEPPPLPVSFDDPGRPLVYFTLGTFSNNDLDLFALVLETLADEAVNVLVTIGRENDPAVLKAVPHNARVERFVPQGEVLPHCSAVIHHAGAGTMLGVLAHGLASLALPQSADNFDNAALLGKSGAAHVLMPGEVTGEAVRSGLRRLLEIPSYRERAEELASEIRAMPSPAGVAALLADRAG